MVERTMFLMLNAIFAELHAANIYYMTQMNEHTPEFQRFIATSQLGLESSAEAVALQSAEEQKNNEGEDLASNFGRN